MSGSGKLAIFRRSGRASTLALGFTSEFITLHTLENDDWVTIGQAAVSSPDFGEQIRALRAEAQARNGSNARVTILLPPEQVIERHYTLAAVSPDARWAEATRRIADETPHTPHDISVAIASESRFEPVKVLAILLQTMTEARSHAAGWGFTPGHVSTQVGMRGFAPPGPVFRYPRSVANKAGRTVRRAAVTAAALAAVAGGAFGAYRLAEPMLETPVAIGPTGPTPSSFSVFLDPPPGPQIPLGDVEKTVVTHLDLPRMRSRKKSLAPSAGTSSPAVLRKADTPRELEAPDSTGPLKVGDAPDVPKVGSVGRAAPSPVDMDKMVMAAIIPIAPIAEFAGRSAPEPASGNTESGGATPDPNELRHIEIPATEEETSVGTGAAPAKEDPIVVAAAEPPAKATPVDATEFAPEAVAVIPQPRPASTAADEATTTAMRPPAPRPASRAGLPERKLPAPRDAATADRVPPATAGAGRELAVTTDPPTATGAAEEVENSGSDASGGTETAAAGNTDERDDAAKVAEAPAYVAMTSRFGPPPARPGALSANGPAAPEEPASISAETGTVAKTDRAPTTDTAGTTVGTAAADTAPADETTAETAATDETGTAVESPTTYVAMTSRFGPPPARPGARPAAGPPVSGNDVTKTEASDAEIDRADTTTDQAPGPTALAAKATDVPAGTDPTDGTGTAPANTTEEPGTANEVDTGTTPSVAYVAMTSRFGPPPMRPGAPAASAERVADSRRPTAPEGDDAEETLATTGPASDAAAVATTTTDEAETTAADTTDETDATPVAPAPYIAMTSRFGPPPMRPGSRTKDVTGTALEFTPTATDVEARTETARGLPAPRPESLVRLVPETPGPKSDTANNDAAPKTDPAKSAAISAPDPRPGRRTATAGIASDAIRNDDIARGSPDDGGSTAGIPVAALTIPTGRPEDLDLSGAPKRDETPVSPESRERLALAPATTELRSDRKSGAAIAKAPEPSKRPRTLEFHARRAPARTRTPLSVYLPRSVGDAAKRTGLALNKTNLIGVIEAKTGRQALVRLPDGGFRKVSRGDSIEGWRVSAVNRESVRLTRRGEKRTLLLVAP